MSLGKCNACGNDVPAGTSFINIGPTDWSDPSKPRTIRWVPADEDIHGWSPFVIAHPTCFAKENGVEALVRLVDESHRYLRATLMR